MPVDVLAIAAHRDDVELTCAGTLLKATDAGYRTAILDLTAGETGTRGSAELRAAEAERAAGLLGVAERRNAGLPDAHLENTEATRRLLVEQLRYFAPRVVILPFPVGRHPDHRIASELGRDACFLAGLAKYGGGGAPHRPHKILYALSYREDPIKPTFVVDISAQFDRKLASVRCYETQFPPEKAQVFDRIRGYGLLAGAAAGVTYGETFVNTRSIVTKDLVQLLLGSKPVTGGEVAPLST